MPKLIIDNIQVEVPDGTTVLEAAQSVDIPIPHFCWHPALGKAGACRVCAVRMLDGPVKGIQMSCMLPAQDGMVVSTTDPDAVAMRRQVIEWLMINHPHDCPVCDEGGECQLQDFTIAGGHGIRRYTGRKRTHLNQDLGAYIEHEMNRCIQCYRCVRFYQEYAGGTDLGVMGSAGRVYFGRFTGGQLESPFSGNLVDICPTGVFTDKTARFKARYWDYDMAPSICPGCSLGCNTTPMARYRELLKVTARRNDSVNGWFICDRGRFSNGAVNDPQRPRVPMVDNRETDFDEALEALLLRIGQVEDLYGSGSIAIVGSSRMTLETAALLPLLADCTASGTLCYFINEDEAAVTQAAVSLHETVPAASMADVAQADCIVILESDLREEGPMMLLAVRQAWKRGAPVFLVGKTAPLAQAMAVSVEAITLGFIEEVPFGIFDKPVIICGTKNSSVGDIEYLARAEARLAFLFSGPDSFGAALLAGKNDAISLEAALAGGRIKGVISVEADIPQQLLEGIPLVAALDWRNTKVVQAAQVVFPTTSWVEMNGTFINYEGRIQCFKKVMNPGIPVNEPGSACHPPHVHRNIPPGGEALPSWQIVAEIIIGLGGELVTEPFSGELASIRGVAAEHEGVMIHDL
jgi:NADH-quinone oxidoreductase subunit G